MYNKDSVEIYQEIDFEKRSKGQICAHFKLYHVNGNEAESKERVTTNRCKIFEK